MQTLYAMCQAFKETGVLLLIKQGSEYSAQTAADDNGYFLYATLLSSLFSLDPQIAANTLFGVLLYVPLFLMGTFFYKLFPTRVSLLVITLGLVRLSMPLMDLNHPYIAYFSVFLLIPSVLLFEGDKPSFWFYGVSFLAGLYCSGLDLMRSFASLPVIVFLFVYVVFRQHAIVKQKALLIGLFCVGYLVPVTYFSHLVKIRNNFLINQNLSIPERDNHVFWHNIYTGLGYLNNSEGITWSDSCAGEAALKINPEAKYPSKLYEQTIRDEIFRLCKEKRYFMATTLFAKLGVIFYYFLIYFGWIGLLCSYFYPKPWHIELAFWAALGVSALPGILTIPVTAYLIGFITCTIVYVLHTF